MRLETVEDQHRASRVAPDQALHRLLIHALALVAPDNRPVRACLDEALALIDMDSSEPTPPPDGRRPMLAPWQARRVAHQVADQIAEPLRVEDLSAPTRLTTGYFSKAFRGTFGMSPHAYLVERRLERACELMLRTDESLAQIAVACGLYDQAHLTRLFRKRHGQSPGVWRRAQLAAPAGDLTPQSNGANP